MAGNLFQMRSVTWVMMTSLFLSLFPAPAFCVLVAASGETLPGNADTSGNGEGGKAGGEVSYLQPVRLQARGVATLKPKPTPVPEDDFSNVGLGKSMRKVPDVTMAADEKLALQDASSALRLGIPRMDLADQLERIAFKSERSRLLQQIADALRLGKADPQTAESIRELLEA